MSRSFTDPFRTQIGPAFSVHSLFLLLCFALWTYNMSSHFIKPLYSVDVVVLFWQFESHCFWKFRKWTKCSTFNPLNYKSGCGILNNLTMYHRVFGLLPMLLNRSCLDLPNCGIGGISKLKKKTKKTLLHRHALLSVWL